MTTLIKTLTAAGMIALGSTGAYAASHEMDVTNLTCEEFLAMDDAGKQSATDAMYMALTEEGDNAQEPMTEEQSAAMMTECEGNPEMLAMDAIGGATSR